MTTLRLYKSYSFKDKDPIIDRMRTMIADEKITYSDLSDQSGVSEATLYQWFNGATRRPQFATVMAVVRSMGYDLQVVRQQRRAATIIVLPKRNAKAA